MLDSRLDGIIELAQRVSDATARYLDELHVRFPKAFVGIDRRTALGLGLLVPNSDEVHQRIAGDVPFSSGGDNDGCADVGMAKESGQTSMDERGVVLDRGTLSLGMCNDSNSIKVVVALIAIFSLLFVTRPAGSERNDGRRGRCSEGNDGNVVASTNATSIGTAISQKGRGVFSIVGSGVGLVRPHHRKAPLFQYEGTVRRHVQIDEVDGLHIQQRADSLALLAVRSAEPTSEGIGRLGVDQDVARLDAADGMSERQAPRQQPLPILGRFDGEPMALEARGREGNEPSRGGRGGGRG
mmetsp:Transcript_15356/g.44431  ORF Transcript_15356/g.44431 Transcript_15356/m.44431 type:complete len:297 (-) Transcript_15356:103-993(-)